MLCQHEPSLNHASSSQARQSPGILTPASNSSVNDGQDGAAKKRKRDGNSTEDLLKDAFVVRPYRSLHPVKPRTLQPLLLLPRVALPLSYLSTVSSPDLLASSRLYEAHVKILELEERMGNQPMLLIARLDDGRTLFAVEREDRGLYVLCQLGSWVDLRQLRVAAVVSKPEASRTLDCGSRPTLFHQDSQCVPPVPPGSSQYSKKKRLAIEAIQSMVKRPTTAVVEEPQPTPVDESIAVSYTIAPESQSRIIKGEESQPTAADVFETIRTQYFETLYLSKASLAYFAKGPLSRARAAFHLDYDSNLNMNDLIVFLESLILSSTLIDKKYRDGLTGCISVAELHDHTADEASQNAGKVKKRRASKKLKPSKNGLYANEEHLIRQWWAAHDNDTELGAPGTSIELLTKKRIAELRIRETQLQIIVILEVLALQPLATAADDAEKELPGVVPTVEAADRKDKAAKPKKPDHLSMLIDVHIDRLCIWQSIALESVETGLFDGQPLLEGSSAALPSSSDNFLRDFCVEVIAPFFSARLPERCTSINRKLGGPIVPSLTKSKPKLTKSASFSHTHSRPGAATKRPVPTKPRQSLQRVLTDERERRSLSRGPSTSKAISLMRSATMPLGLPPFKKEGSEALSLYNIPPADTQVLEASRGGVLSSRRFSRREVDLSSLARPPSLLTKGKMPVGVEAELQEAISALKKPNRELAGKSQVELAEMRARVIVAGSARKSKKPIRNPLFPAVRSIQISATPKANRAKDMTLASQNQHLALCFEKDDLAAVPPSSIPRIPQSALRPSNDSLLLPTLNNSPFLATPTRKPAADGPRGRTTLFEAPVVDVSPLQPRQSNGQGHLFATVPDSAAKTRERTFVSDPAVQETPVKRGLSAAWSDFQPPLLSTPRRGK